MVLEHLTLVTLNFDQVTPIGFLCYTGWMCGLSLRKVGQGILQLLIGNGFGRFDPVTLTFDPKMNEEGR